MLIDSIRIQGYRSLKDVEFRPGRISCVVGANGAGKSNLVHALTFVKMVYGYGLGPAILAEDGFDAAVWRGHGQIADSISVSIESRLPAEVLVGPRTNLDVRGQDIVSSLSADMLAVLHHFTIGRQSQGAFSGFIVDDEQVQVYRTSQKDELTLIQGSRSRDRSSYSYVVEPSAPGVLRQLLDTYPHASSNGRTDKVSFSPPASDLAISTHRLFSPVIDHYIRELGGIRTYNLIASNGRGSGLPIPNGELSTEGWGLPTAVAVLQNQYPEAWTAVLETFFEVAPRFSDVEVNQEYDGRLTLRFLEEDGEQRWHSAQVSDGTLRSLALLVALFDPRHRLTVVEEPENSLHPWAVRVILDACRKAVGSADKQIVLTTHSPVVIDRMRPDELYVTWRENDGTRLSPLAERDPEAPRLWEQGLSDLSGLLDSGWVRESVPLINR